MFLLRYTNMYIPPLPHLLHPLPGNSNNTLLSHTESRNKCIHESAQCSKCTRRTPLHHGAHVLNPSKPSPPPSNQHRLYSARRPLVPIKTLASTGFMIAQPTTTANFLFRSTVLAVRGHPRNGFGFMAIRGRTFYRTHGGGGGFNSIETRLAPIDIAPNMIAFQQMLFATDR